MSDFRRFIDKHWGGLTQCAMVLGVTRQTVANWINDNPRGMLKHAPEIVANKNLTWTQLSGEILYAESELQSRRSDA